MDTFKEVTDFICSATINLLGTEAAGQKSEFIEVLSADRRSKSKHDNLDFTQPKWEIRA